MPAELTGATQTLIINTLSFHKSLTTKEIAEVTKKKHATIKSCISKLRALNMLYICGYEFSKKNRESVIWALGSRPDAKRPDFGERKKIRHRKAQHTYYMKKKLKKIGPSPWAELLK